VLSSSRQEGFVDGFHRLLAFGKVNDNGDLISLVEIISMLTPSRARVSNIFPAIPEWLFMPTPTIESFPILSVAMTSPKPMSFFEAIDNFLRFEKFGLSTVEG